MKKTIIKIMALTLALVMTCAMLASCGGPASTPEKAEEALKKNDYSVQVLDNELTLLAVSAFAGDVEAVVVGASKDLKDGVTIFYYADAKAANEAWADVKEAMEKDADEETDLVIKKSGKMIYAGTKDAIKAAG